MSVAFVITGGKSYAICDDDLPKFCKYCDNRFYCYTHAQEIMTLKEYHRRINLGLM